MGDKAAAKKLMGEANVDYKAAKYDPAIEKYTKAMGLDPKEPQYPTNRAMVYLLLIFHVCKDILNTKKPSVLHTAHCRC